MHDDITFSTDLLWGEMIECLGSWKPSCAGRMEDRWDTMPAAVAGAQGMRPKSGGTKRN